MRSNRRDRWRGLTRRLAVIALLGSALAGCGGAGDGPVPTEGSRAVRTIDSLSATRSVEVGHRFVAPMANRFHLRERLLQIFLVDIQKRHSPSNACLELSALPLNHPERKNHVL